MRYLFIGLFVMSLIAGISAWQLNKSQGEAGILGKALNTVGVKQKESVQRARISNLVKTVLKDQARLLEDYQDQKVFLEHSNDSLKSLSDLASSVMDKNDSDLLRMKTMMADLQDRNRLLIEKGQELVKRNQELQEERYNQRMAHELDRDSQDFLKNHQQYLQNLTSQSSSTVAIMQALKDKLNTLPESSSAATGIVDVKERIEALNLKARTMIDKTREQQDRIRDLNELARERIQSVKERAQDLNDLHQQQYADTKDLLLERRQTLEDRTQDQLERLKAMREYNRK